MTELQKDRQGKSSIAPTFSKRGYNDTLQSQVDLVNDNVQTKLGLIPSIRSCLFVFKI